MRTIFAMFSFTVWLTTLPSANGEGSRLCCKTAQECESLTKKLEGTRGSDFSKTFDAYKLLTSGIWYLTEKNGSPIFDGDIGSWMLTKKDLAGSYTFSTSKMSVVNRWYRDSEIGINKDGAKTMGIDSVCLEPSQLLVKVDGSNFVISSELKQVEIQAAKNSGLTSSKKRQALEVKTDYGSFLFSREPTQESKNHAPQNPRQPPKNQRGVASIFW